MSLKYDGFFLFPGQVKACDLWFPPLRRLFEAIHAPCPCSICFRATPHRSTFYNQPIFLRFIRHSRFEQSSTRMRISYALFYRRSEWPLYVSLRRSDKRRKETRDLHNSLEGLHYVRWRITLQGQLNLDEMVYRGYWFRCPTES